MNKLSVPKTNRRRIYAAKNYYILCDEKDIRRRKNCNLWYERWNKLAKLLKTKNNEAIMNYVFGLIETCSGHKSARVAFSSSIDMNIVIEDCLNKNCEECDSRFSCYTERHETTA